MYMLIAMMHQILVMAAVLWMLTAAASVVVVVEVLLALLLVVAADVHLLMEIFPHLQLDVVLVMDFVVFHLLILVLVIFLYH